MKWVFRLSPSRPLSHDEAKGCFAANLALPGAGSLAAGRAVGYAQMAISTVAFIITAAGSVRMLRWFMATGGPSANGDVSTNLVDIWRYMRWPLFGLGIFLIALFWGMITGWQILAASPKNPVPPRIS